MKTGWTILRLSILSLLLYISAVAHTGSTGALTGEITDQNRAVLAGVQVSVVNEATGEKRDLVSQENGTYVVPLLLPGSYRVEFSKEGFRASVISGVRVNVTETRRVDV